MNITDSSCYAVFASENIMGFLKSINSCSPAALYFSFFRCLIIADYLIRSWSSVSKCTLLLQNNLIDRWS